MEVKLRGKLLKVLSRDTRESSECATLLFQIANGEYVDHIKVKLWYNPLKRDEIKLDKLIDQDIHLWGKIRQDKLTGDYWHRLTNYIQITEIRLIDKLIKDKQDKNRRQLLAYEYQHRVKQLNNAISWNDERNEEYKKELADWQVKYLTAEDYIKANWDRDDRYPWEIERDNIKAEIDREERYKIEE